MNAREKFLSTMEFDTAMSPPLYELGCWVGTARRWYREGLTSKSGIDDDLPNGECLGISFGPRDRRFLDAGGLVKLDKSTEKIPIESWIFPEFQLETIETSGDNIVVIDEMGIKKKTNKTKSTVPQYLEWPVRTKEDWERFKSERLDSRTRGRYPSDLDEIIAVSRERDYPLYIGGHPVGFFGSLRYLMGETGLYTSYYDNPGLVKEIVSYLCDFWIEVWSPIFSKVCPDFVMMWEDMCYKNGPLVSPEIFREFMLPAYKKFTAFLKDNGVKTIIVDTDGNCWKLIPLFVEGGVTGLLPMEVVAGMSVTKVRKLFPRLQIMGGIDKRVLAKDKAFIDQELETKVSFMVKKSGYVPFVDHYVPPDVPLSNFVYYRKHLEEVCQISFHG